jgi:hypothetical protein
MKHHRFQYNINEQDSIEVQFDYDENEDCISNINLYSNFISGLPANPKLEFIDNELRFKTNFTKIINEQVVEMFEYSNDNLSRSLIKEIYKTIGKKLPNT